MYSMLRDVDWRGYKFLLMFFIFSLLLCVFCMNVFRNAEKNLLLSQAKLSQQKNTNRNAQTQLEIFAVNFPEYQELLAKGIVGESQRLQWLETLQASGDVYELPKLMFKLNNERAAAEDSDFYWQPDLPFSKTALDLDFVLLHEGDFFNFIEYFHSQANGLFSVERCELRKFATSEENDYLQGMSGKCSFSAYVLQAVIAGDETL